jgi:hypothetical protein
MTRSSSFWSETSVLFEALFDIGSFDEENGAAHFCVDLDQGIVRVGSFARVPDEQAVSSLPLNRKIVREL